MTAPIPATDGLAEWVSPGEMIGRAKVSKSTFYKYMAKDGAPPKDADGNYNYIPTLKWIEDSLGKDVNENLKTKKIEKLDIENHRNRLKLDREAGFLVARDELEVALARVGNVQRSILSAALVQEMPVRMEGMTIQERRAYGMELLDKLCLEMQGVMGKIGNGT